MTHLSVLIPSLWSDPQPGLEDFLPPIVQHVLTFRLRVHMINTHPSLDVAPGLLGWTRASCVQAVSMRLLHVVSHRWPRLEASPCPSAVTSHCWTTSPASTSRPPSTSPVWHSRVCPCRPDPPSSARRPSPSSKHSSCAPPPFRVSMHDVMKNAHLLFLFLVIWLHLFFTGLQTSNKASGYPVRMDNSVPLVPQNQSSQSLHIQPGMLTQVGPSQVEVFHVVSLCMFRK